MRHAKLHKAVEDLAIAAYGVLESPAEGLTIRQAEAIAHDTQRVIKITRRIVGALDAFGRTNSEEFLKG